MPLTGAWLEARRGRDPRQAVLHEVDERHSLVEEVDTTVPPIWQAPAYDESAPAPPEIGLEWVTNPTDAPGVVLQYPPVDHSYSPGHGVSQTGTEGYANPVLQTSDTVHSTEVAEGLPGNASAVPEAALRRGLNAEAQNNPPSSSYGGEGFRRGRYYWPTTRRDFSPPWRRHGFRIVRPMTPAFGGDSPPPDTPGPYNSPFSSLARNVRNLNARPSLRRVPPPVDEAIMVEATDAQQDYVAAGNYTDTWIAG